MVNLVNASANVVSGGISVVRQKLNEVMVQHSVFAALVFLIVAHPTTFQFVDSCIHVKDKNMLLLFHAFVVGVIMYFASVYLFTPVMNMILSDGFKNSKKRKK